MPKVQPNSLLPVAATIALMLAAATHVGIPTANVWAVPVAAAQQAAPGVPAEALHLLVGRSLVFSSPIRVTRVSVADPAIVDALAVSPMQILVNGKSPGVSSLVIWDEAWQRRTFDA